MTGGDAVQNAVRRRLNSIREPHSRCETLVDWLVMPLSFVLLAPLFGTICVGLWMSVTAIGLGPIKLIKGFLLVLLFGTPIAYPTTEWYVVLASTVFLVAGLVRGRLILADAALSGLVAGSTMVLVDAFHGRAQLRGMETCVVLSVMAASVLCAAIARQLAAPPAPEPKADGTASGEDVAPLPL